MKNFKRALTGGLITMAVFYIVCEFFMTPFAAFFFVGDTFTISYHMYTYIGITMLASIIIFCTILIIDKLNEIIKLIKDGADDCQKTDS